MPHQGFNPLADFQAGRRGELQNQLLSQNVQREQSAAPVRNQLAQLNLQGVQNQQANQQVVQGRQQTGFDQKQAMQKAQILNNISRALRGTPEENRMQARDAILSQVDPSFGITPDLFPDERLTNDQLDIGIQGTQSILSDPQVLSTKMREQQANLQAIQGALDGQGRFDPTKANASQRAAAIALNLVSGAGRTTASERIAGDPGLAENVADTQGAIAGAKEGAKLGAQFKLIPKIRAAVKEAEAIAKSRGETFTELDQAKASLPGIRDVVVRLESLSDIASFTAAGRGFDAIMKQFGFATEGGTARVAMAAIVRNQVLPMLRPIFGAAFTAAEGDKLETAFLDIDATPEGRKASLRSFVEQVERNIETKERELELGSQQPAEQPGQRQGGQIMIDANGNRARVFDDGTFEEL